MLHWDTDPAHWQGFILYYNPEEPRLFVRNRTGLGFTLNFAKPVAWAITLTTIAALIAIVYFVNNLF